MNNQPELKKNNEDCKKQPKNTEQPRLNFSASTRTFANDA